MLATGDTIEVEDLIIKGKIYIYTLSTSILFDIRKK